MLAPSFELFDASQKTHALWYAFKLQVKHTERAAHRWAAGVEVELKMQGIPLQQPSSSLGGTFLFP